MISCYIIDDEFHAVEVLSDYIGKTPGMKLLGSATNPLKGLEEITGAMPPDLLFLDVNMPEITGLELARLITKHTSVVFTTSFREFGPEAYDVGAIYYLLKPIGYEQFLKCVQKYRQEQLSRENKTVKEQFSFFVKTDTKGKLVRIIASEIIYVSGDSNYLQIHLAGERIKAYLTITELLEQLPSAMFCRPHRSYIVNLQHVRGIEPGQIRLSNQAVVDVGATYRDAFMEKLNSMLIISHRDREH